MERVIKNIMTTSAIKLNMNQRRVIFYGLELVEKDGYLCTDIQVGTRGKVVTKKIMRVGECINIRSPYAELLRDRYYEVIEREE